MVSSTLCYFLPHRKTIESIHIKVLQERERKREIKGLKKDGQV